MSSKNCTSSGAPCISAWARVTARDPAPEPGRSCPLSAHLPCSCPRGGLLVEVEVAWRTLLEPEPVVVRRVLQELGRLLEHVVFLRPSLRIALGGFSLPRMFGFDVVFGGLLAEVILGQRLGARVRASRLTRRGAGRRGRRAGGRGPRLRPPRRHRR